MSMEESLALCVIVRLDVDKLLHALNNVRFGNWKVVAKVSSFDRVGDNRKAVSNRVEEEKIREGEKSKIEEEKRKASVGGEVKVAGVLSDIVTGTQNQIEVQAKKVYVCKYRSDDIDVSWASEGLVMSVVNGEAIHVVQRRIFDVGFENLDIIPLGVDKVLVRTSDKEDVSNVLLKATYFFDHFFSTPVKWNKGVLIRERGAWVRIYGVPLHAWNLNFFKLCVFDCGRLLRVDEVTVEKERLDYARVFVATSSVEVINTNAKLMVDGVIFYFKIIEEWGFSLGEDACLFDEEDA